MRATLVLAVLVGSGCGEVESQPLAPARAAEPQSRALGWREPYPAQGPALVFRVEKLEIRTDGWSVEIALTNSTKTSFDVGVGPTGHAFGLMLFANGDLAELEEAAGTGDLPSLRKATSISPRPPPVLAPGQTWRATLSAPGSLADGRWLRVSFGPLRAQGELPAGIEPVVVWITDRAHRL